MIDQFLIGAHRNFTYLVTFDGQSLVIDPQDDLSPWQARMKELGSQLVGVALTHTHWDHVGGVPGIVKAYGSPRIYLHEKDARRLNREHEEVRSRFVFVKDGDVISVGSRQLEALHTPGHSSGECCYLLRESPYKLFTGDTVFVGNVGRCDLDTGSVREMFATIERLKKLPPETVIYPGHDYGTTPTSTIGRESRESAAFHCTSIEDLDAIP